MLRVRRARVRTGGHRRVVLLVSRSWNRILSCGSRSRDDRSERGSGVPTSQQPDRVPPNVDKRGNPQPGRIYEFDVPKKGGGTRTVQIRDDAGGHNFGPNDKQNRGPHFNDSGGNHYDY